MAARDAIRRVPMPGGTDGCIVTPTQKKSETQPEPWLRGTLTAAPAEQRAVLHALQLAREDVDLWCSSLREEELTARPHSLPSVAFQLRHIVGSLDRLLTYAERKPLTDEQLRGMAAERNAPANGAELFAEFESGLSAAERRIREIGIEQWPEARTVGRRELPTTVAGLLIHCADHTQRHVGQAVTTAKVILALRNDAAG